MNPVANPTVLQTYQVVLYNRALHPELFQLKGRKVLRHPGYEVEAWITPGGHVVRFEHNGACFSELAGEDQASTPGAGIVTAFLCAGERDYDHLFEPQKVNYMTTVQTEQLSENLYAGTYEEMDDFGREMDAMVHAWTDESGRNLSVLDVQRMSREVHIQAYHLIARGGVVIRTQSIFECR